MSTHMPPNNKVNIDSPDDTFLNQTPMKKIMENIFNEETADVIFVFERSDQKVPAHKALLAAISPVFNAMFNGELKEKGDVKIADASPEAFKEFLQFFYGDSVKLTTANIERVLNCTNKYDMPDCMRICEKFMQSQVTLGNVCWNLRLALLHSLEDLKKECGIKASEKSKEVFESPSFITSSLAVVKSLLELETFSCNETVVFDSCVKWAKQMCKKQQIDDTHAKNLRMQLGDCFSLIRFGEMDMNDFVTRFTSNNGMFTATELENVFEEILDNKDKKKRFRCVHQPVFFTCEIPCSTNNRSIFHHHIMSFKSNKEIFLYEFFCSRIWSWREDDGAQLPTTINIYERPFITSQKTYLRSKESTFTNKETCIHWGTTPITIRPSCEYFIVCSFFEEKLDEFTTTGCSMVSKWQPQNVQLEINYIGSGFDFISSSDTVSSGMVTRLNFKE